MNKSIVYLQGGLGNQMFQYSFYIFLRKNNPSVEYDTSLYITEKGHNGYELECVFSIPNKRSLIRLLLFKISSYAYHRKFLLGCFFKKIFPYYTDGQLDYLPNNRKNGVYAGYWQSAQFVETVRREILTIFDFCTENMSDDCNLIVERIKESECSVSIHIRRGDFLNENNIRIYGDICTDIYYEKAIEKIKSVFSNAEFFIFTNDPAWVRTNMHIPKSTIVDCNTGKLSYMDMYLMSICKHNVIANSTFSWWGAYLNKNPQKIVIAPSRFTNINNPINIYPNEWIKIDG